MDSDQPLLADVVPENRKEEKWVESLDYEPIHSMVYAQQKKVQPRRHLYGFTGVTLAKWLITLTIGFLVGTVAYVFSSHQELITIYKKRGIMYALNEGYGLWVAFVGYCVFGVSVVTLASCLVIFWTPAAAGGGVTLVMAYLNGNDVPDFFRTDTLFAKVIGTLCTVSSGLPIGQEGPMVHIGGAIASALTWLQGYVPRRKIGGHLRPRSWFAMLKPKSFVFDFHNDYDRREFISAGAAAGLAAAFGSPIGGVLFALEEASSFWSKKVMWRSLLATSIATLVLSWLHEREFSFALPGTMSFHNLKPEFVLGDLPLFVITSAAAGSLGSLVNAVHAWLAQIRPPPEKKLARLVEAIVVTFIIIVMMFVLAHFCGSCHFVPDGEADIEEFWFQYTCPNSVEGSGYYNDLASLYLAVPRQTIQKLFKLGKATVPAFAKMTLAVHCVSWIIIFSLAYGIATPGGIFLPCMVVGSSCGALLGMLFKVLFPTGDVQPGLHALIGATAMLASMFRTSISVVVIIVEGTGGVDFILPLILAVVISNWVAHHLHHESAYEIDLDNTGSITFLHNEPSHGLIPMTAEGIMARQVECLPEIATVKEVVEVLTRTKHNGFPVLRFTNEVSDDAEPKTQGTFVGLILRHQLLLLIEQKAWIYVEEPGTGEMVPVVPGAESTYEPDKMWKYEHAMRVYHHCHNPHRRYLSSRPEEVDMLDLSEDQCINSSSTQSSQQTVTFNDIPPVKKERVLDLRPFMNRAPLTVRTECSAQRVFIIFRTLGLRHLCVVDTYNKVVGMITRKDIAKAHKQSHNSVHEEGDSKIYSNTDLIYHLP